MTIREFNTAFEEIFYEEGDTIHSSIASLLNRYPILAPFEEIILSEEWCDIYTDDEDCGPYFEELHFVDLLDAAVDYYLGKMEVVTETEYCGTTKPELLLMSWIIRNPETNEYYYSLNNCHYYL